MSTTSSSKRMESIELEPDLSSPVLIELRISLIQLLPLGVRGTRYEDLVTPYMLEMAASQAIKDIQSFSESFDDKQKLMHTALKHAVRHLLYQIRYSEWESASIKEGIPAVPAEWRTALDRNPVLRYAHDIFSEELTENQRIAIRSMVMFSVPKENVMEFLGMDRCAYFGMIHDARIRIKKRLHKDGEENVSGDSLVGLDHFNQ